MRKPASVRWRVSTSTLESLSVTHSALGERRATDTSYLKPSTTRLSRKRVRLRGVDIYHVASVSVASACMTPPGPSAALKRT